MAASALAGSVLFSASPASAACPSPDVAGGFTLEIISAPTGPAGTTFTCDLTNPGGNPIQANEDVDFDPNIFNGSGTYEYKLTSSIGNFLYAGVDSDTDGMGGSTLLTKQIFADAGFTTLLATLISTDGSSVDMVPLPGAGPMLWVRDTYSATGTTGLDNITNKFMTPGPLPVLGAGAAFGFSRKLRGRIKASRSV